MDGGNAGTERLDKWLRDLPSAPRPVVPSSLPRSPTHPTKRKRRSQHDTQLSSPPPSRVDPDMDSTTTRRKRPRHMMDSDPTPRHGEADSSRSDSQSSASYLSSPSRSNRKTLLELSLADNGIDVRQLSVDSAPNPAVGKLLQVMREVSSGHDILPSSRREEILSDPNCCPDGDLRQWRYSFRPETDEDTLPGRIPTTAEVASIQGRARLCHDQRHDEAGWNMEVHHLLLSSILRDAADLTGGMDGFNVSSCTTARLHPVFVPNKAPSEKIDFCIVAEQQQQEPLKAHRELARLTPTLSVNPTDFAPLQLRPIVLSIETKTSGNDLDAANLQLGVWHAAQWSFLASAVAHSIRAARTRSPSGAGLGPASSSANEIEISSLSRERVGRLPFIPGIVVQGHRWSLVLSTREGERTVLWTDWGFGTTQSMQNIFKIVAGLRELTDWCRSVYMPWWRDNVLAGFSSPESGHETQ